MTESFSMLAAFLQASPAALLICCALFGLCVGSFLNVVILRLPRMMERNWKQECRVLLELPEEATEPLSLMRPASRCGGCGAAIRPWQNVPVISWLLLRGRCANCAKPISAQYPIVEAVTAILSAVCAWRFGWSVQLAAALVFSWALVALTVIDLREMLLPDDITLPLLWLGLLLSTQSVFVGTGASIWGAALGYLALWSIYHLFKLATGKEGMGYGDFKLLAALGAWFGGMSLPVIILLSSVVGAVVGIALILVRGRDRNLPIPFGPYLAGAGWLTLIWGDAVGRLIVPH